MPVPTESELSRAVELAASVRTEIGRAVVGQETVLDEVVAAFFAGGHVLLEGVPGLGKTLIVLALARTFGGRSVRLQFTPDLMPSDVVGHTMFDVRTSEFRVRRGPAFTNLLLADEINRASAKTQAALLEVMQEGQITIEGTSFPLEPPFMTLATQNPIELEGTYPLPEAQLDRFLLKIRIGYPGEEEELRMLAAVTEGQVGERLDVSAVRQVATREEVLAVQRAAGGLTVDPRVTAYALRIVRASRTWPGIRVGAGPRGGIALVRIARARALMAGRDFVTPDDVKGGTLSALRHRIALAPDLEIEGRDADEVLSGLLEGVEAPRQ
ncbi:MAG TPA: MoxR family ATPase [Candidatus Polarisedimenticolaceae bacterium]|nr:MoxR family ATPase [Candidatus Polarisedimenticolaceae bacterium]